MSTTSLFVCTTSEDFSFAEKYAPQPCTTMLLSDLDSAKEKYNHITFLTHTTPTTNHTTSLLHSLSLQGTATLLLPNNNNKNNNDDNNNNNNTLKEEEVRNVLVCGGFVDVEVAQNIDNFLKVTGKKPSWETGTSAQIKIKKSQNPQPSRDVWSIGGEDELVDESDIALAPPALPETNKKAGCPPTRKACKNCSCGRAEEEANGKTVMLGDLDSSENDQQQQPVKSSCGNCSLGDAYRCATCPFLGLPPFEKGQEGAVLLTQGKLMDV